MIKRTLIFERTITERVTVEMELNEDIDERDVQGWANFDPQVLDDAQLYPGRINHRGKWMLDAADPPFEPRPRRGRRPKTPTEDD